MAKFIYSMQNVLNIKERMETQAKTEYAQMLGALHDEEVKMHNIMSTLNSYKVQASQLSIGKLDIAKIRRCNEAIKITEDMAKNQAVMVKLAERNVEASMKRLADAVKERKVQEKLKEKAFEQFLQELNAQEMKEIDEVVSFNYNGEQITMAKKKSKEELDIDDSLDLNDEEESSGGNKLLNAFIVVVVIAIWLVIFGLLIKMNVGGIGSMLRPFLKNVPVINRILPEATDEEIAEETGSKYKNLAEAIDRINELEAELAQYKDAGTADSSTIADLQAEIARLKVFEDNAQYYQDLKDKFDREVVYTDNAPDISNYKSWYESIDADNAAELYKQVIKDLEYSQKIKDWAEAYAKMDAASAAAILEEMTGDTNLVSQILQCMTSKQRAAVLAEMDPVYAAKITKITHP